MNEITLNKNLPKPRLELSWHRIPEEKQVDGFDFSCEYSLVLGLSEHDIRRENEDGEDVKDEIRLSLGGTRAGRSGRSPVSPSGIDTPYRDSAHARWDSAHLGGLPIFVTFEDRAMRYPSAPVSEAQ